MLSKNLVPSSNTLISFTSMFLAYNYLFVVLSVRLNLKCSPAVIIRYCSSILVLYTETLPLPYPLLTPLILTGIVISESGFYSPFLKQKSFNSYGVSSGTKSLNFSFSFSSGVISIVPSSFGFTVKLIGSISFP